MAPKTYCHICKEKHYESVEAILKDFEAEGRIVKKWDVEKQDYVWHKTKFQLEKERKQ